MVNRLCVFFSLWHFELKQTSHTHTHTHMIINRNLQVTDLRWLVVNSLTYPESFCRTIIESFKAIAFLLFELHMSHMYGYGQLKSNCQKSIMWHRRWISICIVHLYMWHRRWISFCTVYLYIWHRRWISFCSVYLSSEHHRLVACGIHAGIRWRLVLRRTGLGVTHGDSGWFWYSTVCQVSSYRYCTGSENIPRYSYSLSYSCVTP